MFVKIYGRPNCPYCEKAKALAEKLKTTMPDFDYEYIDIIVAGLDKDDLSDMAGRPVSTVPQIFMNEMYVGGFTDFDALMKQLLNK